MTASLRIRLAHFSHLIILLATVGTGGAAFAQVSSPVSPPASRDLTLQQYISELDHSSQILSSDDPVAIHECLAALPSEWVIQTEERPYHVRTDMLRAALIIKERGPTEKSTVVEREKLRLSQEDFAELANVHRTYVSSVELGKVNVGIEVAAES